MKRTLIVLPVCFFVLLVCLWTVAEPSSAHHGRGQTYDGQKEITVKGTVTEFAWRNPHVVVYMDVKDDNGKVENWAFEGGNVSLYTHGMGLNRNTLKPGQEITVVANPSRSGAPVGVLKKVILADGKEIMHSAEGANAAD